MTQPTKDQWKALESGLFGSYGSADLVVDGYKLTLRKVLIGENKLAIWVYVDGAFRGEFITQDCEERRRFMRPIRRKVFSAKSRKSMAKLSKRSLKEMGLDPEHTHTSYMPSWPTFAPLRRHLAHENESIEIVSINGKDVQ